MPFLTTIGMLLGGASAIKGFIGGDQMKRAGRKTLNELRDVEFQNAYANLNPSLKAEETLFGLSGRRMGGMVDIAQGMDAATAMGFMNTGQGKINEMETAGIQSILDKNYQADVLRAGDEVRIQGAEYNRNRALRNEAISQINTGSQMEVSALEGAAGLAISAGAAQEAASAQKGYESPKARRQAVRAEKKGDRTAATTSRLTGRYTALGGSAADLKGLSNFGIRGKIREAGGGVFGSKGFFSKTGGGGQFFSKGGGLSAGWGWLKGLFGGN